MITLKNMDIQTDKSFEKLKFLELQSILLREDNRKRDQTRSKHGWAEQKQQEERTITSELQACVTEVKLLQTPLHN